MKGNKTMMNSFLPSHEQGMTVLARKEEIISIFSITQTDQLTELTPNFHTELVERQEKIFTCKPFAKGFWPLAKNFVLLASHLTRIFTKIIKQTNFKSVFI